MHKILAIGDIYKETQFFVNKIPQENEFVFSNEVVSSIGSKVINTSRVLQKLGNEVLYFGKVGSNSEDDEAIESLKKFGFKTFIQKVPDKKLGQITVITPDSGNSAITLFEGANDVFSKSDIDSLTQQILDTDAIYTATNLPLESLYYLVDFAFKNKKPIFLDVPNRHKDIVLEKLSHVSFFIPNRQEAELLLHTKINSIEDAKKAALSLKQKLSGSVIITLDRDGCVFVENGMQQSTHIATSQVDEIDATASGDIFRAFFVDSYLNTKNVSESVRTALMRATESVSIKGVDATIESIKI